MSSFKDLVEITQLTTKPLPYWQYPITQNFAPIYNLLQAKSLLVFSYYVTVYNFQKLARQHPNQLICPNFDVMIALDTCVLCSKQNVGYFFYSARLNMIVVAFTGTYSAPLLKVDLDYDQIDPKSINNYVPNMKIHGGFWKLYCNISNYLYKLIERYANPSTQILLTGISLGGAISTLCLYDLYGRKINNMELKNIIHYSYGSPRLFNTIGADYFNELNMPSYRVVNISDIIPDSPLQIMPINQDFTHTNTQIPFDTNYGSYFKNHVDSYLKHYNIGH